MTSVSSPPVVDPALRRAALLGFGIAVAMIVLAWFLRRAGFGEWIPNGGRFWATGFAVDIASVVLLWFTTRRRTGPWVAIPGVGWILYAIACISSPTALLFRELAPASLGCLAAKLGEFATLTLLHVSLQFLLPRLFLPKPTDT